jgi:hypothetical protein
MSLHLFLISQSENRDYDTYDSAVVVAADPGGARHMLPWESEDPSCDSFRYRQWCDADDVEVTCVGLAADGLTVGEIICASFRAG